MDKTKETLIKELHDLQHENLSMKESYEKEIRELRRSEQKFRKVYMTSPDSININRLSDGMYVSINDGFTRIMGFTEEEVIGKTSVELNIWFDPEDRNLLVKELETKGEAKNFEARFLSKDGRIIHGLMSASIIDLDGVPHIINVTRDITIRKQAEEALAYEQFLTEVLMNNLPDHIYFKDRQSRFIRINKDHAQSFGLSDPSQAVGKTDFDFFTEEHARQAYEDEQKVIQSGQQLNKEERLTWPDRPDTWSFTTKLPMHDKEGNIIGTFGISRDITERRQAEDAFRKLSLRQEAILAAVPEIIMEVDNNKIYKWANRSGVEFFGNDVIGKEASFYFEGEQETYNLVKPLFSGAEDIFYVESWQRRHDGEKRLLAWWCRVNKDPDGNVTGALSSARDITEQKNLENSILFKQLLLETIIENIPDQIYYKDRNSKFVLCNTPVALLAGCASEKDLIGKSDFDFHPPQLAQQYFNDEQALMEKGEKFLNHEEQIIDKKTGELRWNLSSKVPVKDANGKVIGLAGINHDITERKLAEEEIKLKNELLQTINAEKDKFFSILAHDLKGPLSAFLGATQILAEEIQNMTVKEIEAITISMKESATNIYGLLENLLEWSRLKQGRMNFNPEKIKLEQIITACIELLKESARKKEIKISCSIADDLEIYADLHMLETVIRNLVSNAIKFTSKSGEINVSATMRADNAVEIKIRDTGIGMSQEIISKLFFLNQQTSRKGTEGEPSTGLGLLLCKEFIEMHKGNIWVESEEGKGSAFSFTVPDKG
jgi:PAS domain S-box-containing protein